MPASDEHSRIVVPFMPKLYHISSARIALSLFVNVGQESLERIVSEIESEKSQETEESGAKDFPVQLRTAKDILRFLPTIIRIQLLGAVERVKSEFEDWIRFHQHLNYFDLRNCLVSFGSDGSIDPIETAQSITGNQNVDIRARFEMACMYCLADEVRTLWAEMEATGQAEIYERSGLVTDTTHFWITWVREGFEGSWVWDAVEFFHFHPPTRLALYPIFRELLPENCRLRKEFIGYLNNCSAYDLRFCLCTLTKAEQIKAIESWGAKVLKVQMNWPLTSDFLETAKKSYQFLNGLRFYEILKSLMDCIDRTDYDFETLASEFWNESEQRLKNYVLNHRMPIISGDMMDLSVNEIRLREFVEKMRVKDEKSSKRLRRSL